MDPRGSTGGADVVAAAAVGVGVVVDTVVVVHCRLAPVVEPSASGVEAFVVVVDKWVAVAAAVVAAAAVANWVSLVAAVFWR